MFCRKCNRQCGFTLLEALITIVVVSIGLLGLLGLQAVSLTNTQVSASRGSATIATNNIAERMRANPAGVQANAYDDVDTTTATASPTNCAEARCTAQELAQFDVFQWRANLDTNLPAGRGRITCVDALTTDTDACSPNSPHVVTIIWRESDRVSDANGPSDKCAAFEEEDDDVTDRCLQTTFLP